MMNVVKRDTSSLLSITDNKIDMVEEALLMGASKHAACNYAGITYSSYNLWFDAGKALHEGIDIRNAPRLTPRKDYETDEQWAYRQDRHERACQMLVSFYLRAIKARGQLTLDMLRLIREQAENGQWTAAAWTLERLFPDQYGQRTRVHNEVEVSGRIEHKHSVEHFTQLYAKLGYVKRDELASGDVVEGDLVDTEESVYDGD